MSYIIKQNDPLINLKITDYGRFRLSYGALNFDSFSLGDSEIDYTNKTPVKLNILRPTDNNHDILFKVPYNNNIFNVPITNITSFPKVISTSAKNRGFFSGSTFNLIEPSLTSLYNLSGIITGSSVNVDLKYTQTTGSTTFVNYGIGTGYTTSLKNNNYINVKSGDYLFLKIIQNKYYTGHTTSMNPYINTDPTQYLWYNIVSVNSTSSLPLTGITNNQTINFKLDRELPNFTNCRVKGFIYPGKQTISDYYDKDSPIAYWSNGDLNFTAIPGQETIKDVPVWNMNIINIRDIIGLDNSIYKGREFSNGYEYMGTAIDYGYLTDIYTSVNPNTIVTGTTDNNISGYTQTINKIGVIHYTNNTIANFYGEGFYGNSLKLNIPYLMWHKKQFGGASLASTIGYTFICDDVLKYINGNVPYYDLIDQEVSPTVVGKVLVDQKIIIIEDQELISALSFKSNRNWTLPSPVVSLVDPGHCPGSNIAGSLGINETAHITYLLKNSNGITGIQCENYKTIDNITTKPKDILFQLPKDPLNPLYSEFSYLFDPTSPLGFNISDVSILWQKTEIGGLPNPLEWREFNVNSYMGISGCVDQSSISVTSDMFLKVDDFIFSFPIEDPTFSLSHNPIGDILVFYVTSSGTTVVCGPSIFPPAVTSDTTMCYYLYTESGTTYIKLGSIDIDNHYKVVYLYGESTSAGTIKTQVTVPNNTILNSNTYLDGIYKIGGNINLTLTNQPNNNVVYLFYNGSLLSSTLYGVYPTGTTANRRVQLNFTPSTGSQIVLYYLDASSLGDTIIDSGLMTPNNLNNLRVYIDKDDINNTINNYYDLNDTVILPQIKTNPTGMTFGDEVFFYGNVGVDIKSTIYKTLFTFNVLPNTFITTTNPTFDINSNKVSFSELGVYDADGDLVAIGKFSQPITRKYNSDLLTIQATIDF